MLLLKICVRLSRDMFRVNKSNFMTAHNFIFCSFRAIKDVLRGFEEYITFWKNIIWYLKRPDEEISLANEI